MRHGGLLALALLALPAAAFAQAGPVVTTDAGKVRGTQSDGVVSWKGVPFAAAPVGPLRWRAPQPVPTWRGIRDASAYGADCMQKPAPSDAAPLGTPPAEDRLFVNIWRPAGVTAKLPVMVWIHGGGFVNGGSSPTTYSGATLARDGILVVSLNYRLGRFGTFALPQLTRDDPDKGLLGNYGMLDQVAGLRWVQRNVAAFGGDPSNVTIVGESAGGVSAHILATSKLTARLFGRAVVMSGAEGGRPGTATLAEIEGLGRTFARENRIDPDADDALARLRALPDEAVSGSLKMDTMFNHSPRTYAGPFVDGTIVTDVGAAYAAGAFPRIPMMIGATSGDLDGRTGFMIAGARAASIKLAAKGLPVYQYRFDYVAGSTSDKAAPHATDIPFFFGTVDARYGDRTTRADRTMADTMRRYLVQFVRTGDPNAPGLAAWPRFVRPARPLTTFRRDATAQAGADPWAREIDRAPTPTYPEMIADTRR